MPAQRRVRGPALTDAAELRDLVELYAADARAHDYHTGEPGSFDAAVERLSAAPGASVLTPITRSSYRVLGALPALLARHRVARWTVAVERGAAIDAPRPAPRLALAIPFALHALDRAVKLGIDAHISDAPLCLLGPFAARAITNTPGVFPERCGACSLRPDCAGIDAAYARRFGAGELSPRRA